MRPNRADVAERRAEAAFDDREAVVVDHDLGVVLGAERRPEQSEKSCGHGRAARPLEHPAEDVGGERVVGERAAVLASMGTVRIQVAVSAGMSVRSWVR